MSERVLTTRELNRALLARQLLLERRKLYLPQALERVGGLQTQYAPSGYLGLWSRVEGFRRDDLTRALERRRVVQGTLMRVTIHLVSARDYPLFAAAVRDGRREWWLRAHRGRFTARELARHAQRVRKLLAGGPVGRDELMAAAGNDTAAWNGVGLWLDLVRVPPSATWERRRADLLAAADDWLGPADVDVDNALDHIVRRYLAAFGPARPAEVADWAGLAPAIVGPVLERLDLRRFRDEQGKELVDLPRAPLPDADTPAPVRFLPVWDATLLVHARRTQILPEEYRPRVFNTKTPHSVNTFLVDGAVAGTWRIERKADAATLQLGPFGKLSRAEREALVEEGEQLARFHEPDARTHAVRTSPR